MIYFDLVGLSFGEYGFYFYSMGSCEVGEIDEGKVVVGLVVGGYWDFDEMG